MSDEAIPIKRQRVWRDADKKPATEDELAAAGLLTGEAWRKKKEKQDEERKRINAEVRASYKLTPRKK